MPEARKGWFIEPKAAREIGKSMDVVVLKVDTLRTMWVTGEKKPICWSDDGVLPSPRVKNPVSTVCEGCEHEKKDLVYRIFCYDVTESAEKGEPVIFTIDCKGTQLKTVRAFVQAIRSKDKAARDFKVTMQSQAQENAKGSWFVVQFENIERVSSNIKDDVEAAYRQVTGDSGDDDFDAGDEVAPF